jgi:hypothetical protein
MPEPDLADLQAAETVLKALHPLRTDEQVRVLRWVAEKLELGLDMKLAFRRAAESPNRTYIDLAHERARHGLDTPSEFLAEAKPQSIVDRVLVMATFLQFRCDDPDKDLLSARQINTALRMVGKPVGNVTDCLNTLRERNPPHIFRKPRSVDQNQRTGYRVTEAGIDHVFRMMVFRDADERP